jgi:hypothetical protein
MTNSARWRRLGQALLFAFLTPFASYATPFYNYTVAARTGVDLDGSGFVASSITRALQNGGGVPLPSIPEPSVQAA